MEDRLKKSDNLAGYTEDYLLDGTDKDHERLVEWFRASEFDGETGRNMAINDRNYYDGYQLTPEEIEALNKRGQPPVVINRIRRKVEYLKGLETQRRTDPRAFARSPVHAKGAEAITDAIKYVCDANKWDEIRSKAWENMLIEGVGAAEVLHRQVRQRRARDTSPPINEIQINHYHWDRVFWDMHSRENDFSDARYKGAVKWEDLSDAKRQFPDADFTVATYTSSEAYSDIPNGKRVYSGSRERVQIILMWYRVGAKWYWAQFTKGEWLEGGESPYVTDEGASHCPFHLRSTYCDRWGNRYGVVRDMIDPQDEINKRRSKALFQMTARQTVGTKGAVESVRKMKNELSRPDGHVEVNRGDDLRWEILPQSEQTTGHLALLQEAKSEIDMMGANSALQGETGESTSGRAVLARQQGGMVEISSIFDAKHQFTNDVYESIWYLIRQLWTEEKWIRVTDDQQNVRFVALNKPVTVRETLKEMPDDDAFMLAQRFGFYPGDPRLDLPIGKQNDVEEMDVDIILEEVPEEVSIQSETFQHLVQLAPVVGPLAGPAYAQLLVDLAPISADAKKKLQDGMGQQVVPAGAPPIAQAAGNIRGEAEQLDSMPVVPRV